MRLIPPREILRRIWPSDGKIANPELAPPAYAARHQDATFIVFGNGPSLAENLDAIHALGEKFNAVTMGANNIGEILAPDYHAFTNRKRFAAYSSGIDPVRTRVLLSPYFTDGFIRKHYTGPYEQIMYRADNDAPFDIQNGIIQASCRTVAVLMIAVAVVMGARRIFVAGTDGYKGHLDSGRHVHFYDGDFGPHPPLSAYRRVSLRRHARNFEITRSPACYLARPPAREQIDARLQRARRVLPAVRIDGLRAPFDASGE